MLKLLPVFTISLAAAVTPLAGYADETNFVTLSAPTSDYYTVHVYNGLDEVNPDGGPIAEGSIITIDVTAANDYALTHIYVNGVEQTLDKTNTAATEITYEVGSENIKISVAYESVEYTQTSGTSATSRYINSITVSDGINASTTVAGLGNASGAAIYSDQTSTVAKLNVNTPIQLTVSGVGQWMESYLYIDYDNDGVFEPEFLADNSDRTDVNNYIPTATSELVTHTGFTKGDSTPHWNSKGVETGNESKSCSDNKSVPCVHTTIPTFTIPSDTEPGQYHARYVFAWNNIDPTGMTSPGTGTDNSLATLGGAIIDFTIEVIRPERTVTVQSATCNGEAEGSVAIANQTTTTVTTDGDVRMLATPKGEYEEFMYWTIKYNDGATAAAADDEDEPEIISTDALYTYKGSESATLTAVFGYRVYLFSTVGGTAVVKGGAPTYSTTQTPLSIKNTRTNKTLTSADVTQYGGSEVVPETTTTIEGENSDGVLFETGTKLYANLFACDTSTNTASTVYRIVYLAVNDILFAYASESSSQSITDLSMGFEVTQPMYITATFWNVNTGVEDIAVDTADAPAEYFNLQGIRVDADNLTPGLYILRRGNHTVKVSKK